MKKLINVLIYSGFLSLLIFSCTSPEQKASSSDSTSSEEKVVLAENKANVNMKVEGMVCAMGCAKFIQDKVAKLDGVVLSQVNFEEESAHFEFDKTTTSAEEIEEFINAIHDGQYKAKIASNNEPAPKTDEKETKEKKSIGAVTESLNFSFPELFTYFLKRI